MKRCPICGNEIEQHDYDGLTSARACCAECALLTAQELEDKHPVWYERLPTLNRCWEVCKQVAGDYKGLPVALGAGWVVAQEQVEIEAADPDLQQHPLGNDPWRAAGILYLSIIRYHGLKCCWNCGKWRTDCIPVLMMQQQDGAVREVKRHLCPDCS